jgi:hypothetical protein
MAIAHNATRSSLVIDKDRVRRLAEELNRRMGVTIDPYATPGRAREMMRARGIRPEDNEFSRDLMELRSQKYEPERDDL